MINQIQIFENPEFGEIRILTERKQNIILR